MILITRLPSRGSSYLQQIFRIETHLLFQRIVFIILNDDVTIMISLLKYVSSYNATENTFYDAVNTNKTPIKLHYLLGIQSIKLNGPILGKNHTS